MIVSRGEVAPPCAPALDLELKETIGTAVVKPVDDPPRLDPSRLRIPGEHLDRAPLVHELADLLAGPVREDDPRGVMKTPKHDPDLLADLVDEDHDRARARDGGGELAERLGHEARLQARQRVAHVTVELGAGDQRRHRIDHDHVDGVGADECLGDLERLLAGVRLGDEQLVDVHAELPGVDRVERVLGVDERGDAAQALGLGDDVERQRGLARGLRAVDLGDPSSRQTADAERHVERDGAGRDDRDLLEGTARAETHDRALAELPLDLRDCQL